MQKVLGPPSLIQNAMETTFSPENMAIVFVLLTQILKPIHMSLLIVLYEHELKLERNA